MADHKRIRGIIDDDDKFVELPVDIIQQVQSLLSEQDAARTALVSKSWYRAWLTRPDLVFHQSDFRSRSHILEKLGKKTMQTCIDLKLKIRSLKLISIHDLSLANYLIVEAIELGAVDLEIVFFRSGEPFVLPDEVLRSQTLTRLYLSGNITVHPRPFRERDGEREVTCSNLKSLDLCHVKINGALLKGLMMRCPLIEELTLYRTSIKLDDLDHEFCSKLRYLGMDDTLKINGALHDFWDKFPGLERLKILL